MRTSSGRRETPSTWKEGQAGKRTNLDRIALELRRDADAD